VALTAGTSANKSATVFEYLSACSAAIAADGFGGGWAGVFPPTIAVNM
jgi:hypothetical protein